MALNPYNPTGNRADGALPSWVGQVVQSHECELRNVSVNSKLGWRLPFSGGQEKAVRGRDLQGECGAGRPGIRGESAFVAFVH